MEFVPGGDLRIILDDFGCLDDEHARFYFCEMVMCVHTLHKLGYIHRDLKPANFLIDADGHLKLGDFGLATATDTLASRRASVALTRRAKAFSVVGTPQYMAKDVLSGDGYDASVDWWALGCILYEMILGTVPFDGDTAKEIFDLVRNFGDSLIAKTSEVEADSDGPSLSPGAREVVLKLICDTSVRLGDEHLAEIQTMTWFATIDWTRLRCMEPPFVPNLEGETDSSYFGSDPSERANADPSVDMKQQ